MSVSIDRAMSLGLVVAIVYSICETKAYADNWGCQVILCLSNPGSPTEFAECRPPISRLWKHLAEGHSFPTCSGVGFSASRPGYEPYFCDAGYRLNDRLSDHGREAACVSNQPVVVKGDNCSGGGVGWGQISGRWQWDEGQRVCKAIITKRPNVREQPRFVDVTIDGVGRQRMWF